MYVDDVTLLAPTPSAIRIMLRICDEFAKEYSVIFNIKKMKCLFFQPRGKRLVQTCDLPVFTLNNNSIEYVDQYCHLGNLINTSLSDSDCIVARRNSLIGQLNDVLCYFGKLECHVKSDLLHTYCNSFYGSVLWDLHDKNIDKICTAWCSALRRVWHLPFNTHRNIVYYLSGKLSVLDEFCHRVLVFLLNCLCSQNNILRYVVNFVTQSGLSNSLLGRNLLFICNRYKISYYSIMNNSMLCEISIHFSLYCHRANVNVNRPPSSDMLLLSELLLVRDEHMTLSIDRQDIQDMINYLCTY